MIFQVAAGTLAVGLILAAGAPVLIPRQRARARGD